MARPVTVTASFVVVHRFVPGVQDTSSEDEGDSEEIDEREVQFKDLRRHENRRRLCGLS